MTGKDDSEKNHRPPLDHHQRPLTVVDSQRLIHELQVHQVELELQNDEIRRTRDELEAALQKYADLYNFAPVGYLSLDREGVITAANLTASTLLGAERSRLIGRILPRLMCDDSRVSCAGLVRRVFAHRTKESCDVRFGHELPGIVHARIEATLSRNGEECRAVIVDMTEQRRAEEEVRKLNEELELRVRERTVQLEAAVREQEAFSYSVSHDLRAPLRHINCYTALVKEELGEALSPAGAGYLERVCEVSRHMGDLIDNLLRLPRITEVELIREVVDLSAMATAIAATLQESEPQRRAAFHIESDISAVGNKTLLWLVLKNLLDNAWKYAAPKEETKIEVRRYHCSGRSVVLVRDNGVGFDMAFKEQLFGVFQRLHGREFEGMGIGLATVKRIVERHGGEVWAEGKVNEGTTVYFTLA